MLLSIIDHAYEEVRDTLIETAGDDHVAKMFNEDFAYCCYFPLRVLNKLGTKCIEKSAGGRVDFDKIKEREKIDPAMLMVLKFEKMTTGAPGLADSDSIAGEDLDDQRRQAKLARQQRHLHSKAILTKAILQLEEARKAQDAIAKHLGAPDVATYAKTRQAEGSDGDSSELAPR